MARGKRTIRASEIGSFIFCQRAWWYQRQKVKPRNQDELEDGSDFHSRHWLQTHSMRPLQLAAWLLIILALILLAIYAGLQLAR